MLSVTMNSNIQGLEFSERISESGSVRNALRQGDLESAAKYGRIYELRPLVHQ